MEHNEPPKDTTEKEYTPTPYVSSRLRSKMEDRYEEEEKSPAATIAVVGLLAVIVICGGLFLLGQRNQKSQAGQTAEASNAPEQATAPSDSAAVADSLSRLAAADSMARAASQTTASQPPAPTPAVKSPVQPLPGGAPGNDGTAAPVSPTRYGIAVGSYLFDDKANTEKDRLAGATSLEGTIVEKTEGGATTYQLVLGSFSSRGEAEAKGAELLGAGTVRESRIVPLKKR